MMCQVLAQKGLSLAIRKASEMSRLSSMTGKAASCYRPVVRLALASTVSAMLHTAGHNLSPRLESETL